ncbi:unnamed protein product [Darwinula stevensoni]|uniref:Uncharacterized protein n=1 Tax=Darwinula stevensoni TaxID=69355 RepID=A0A7R9AF15_9CRUS|nr:unnamed protein product [Darwinula stevensoni]CAG0901937.1 unnamed protein product [Darwinula stevensoni]
MFLAIQMPTATFYCWQIMELLSMPALLSSLTLGKSMVQHS